VVAQCVLLLGGHGAVAHTGQVGFHDSDGLGEGILGDAQPSEDPANSGGAAGHVGLGPVVNI